MSGPASALRETLRRVFWRPYQAFRRIADREVFTLRFQRRADELAGAPAAWTTGERADDDALIERIVASYRLSADVPSATGDSEWRGFFDAYHREIHEALLSDRRDRVREMLRDPATCDLFYGFENLSRFLLRGTRLEDREAPALALDGLLSLAEALGVRAMDDPETYRRRRARPDADEVLLAIDAALGIRLEVPNPFPREFGLRTSRGIVSSRVPQGMYQAWRVREELRGAARPRVLELGAGLGRTAFYAHALGMRAYTIVDLPITAVAQGYFLGRALGPDAVTLDGEAPRPGAVRLQSPRSFLAASDRYDLVLNVDSLPEFDPTVAREYWHAFATRADRVLSINHETNKFTVRELIVGSRVPHRHRRFRTWLRRGYVEEIVEFDPREGPASA